MAPNAHTAPPALRFDRDFNTPAADQIVLQSGNDICFWFPYALLQTWAERVLSLVDSAHFQFYWLACAKHLVNIGRALQWPGPYFSIVDNYFKACRKNGGCTGMEAFGQSFRPLRAAAVEVSMRALRNGETSGSADAEGIVARVVPCQYCVYRVGREIEYVMTGIMKPTLGA
ncbi:hypothetical protein Q5752_000647 [Cryptotrichosporon argae]